MDEMAETHVAQKKSARQRRPRKVDAAANSLSTVLNLVRRGLATTRQEIERTSELGRAVVMDRLSTLSDLDLVDESELGVASGGRAPRLVRFNRDVGRLLVATLDQTALGVGIADISGKLLLEHHEALDINAPAQTTCNRIEALFDWLLDKEERAHPAWGIGISVPVPVQISRSDGLLAISPPILPTWERTFFVERMIQRFRAPVWLRSSVETMAMGEVHAGVEPRTGTVLFVRVGRRIGAGLVVDGRLFRGTQGANGLIGQLPAHIDGRTGSLEALAGSDAVARDGLAAAQGDKSAYLADILERTKEITSIDVGQAAQAGDAAAMEIMSRSGRLIGHVVATLTNMLNPSLIVLSGSLAQTNDILLAAVREVVYGESHPLVTRDLRINASRLGSSASLIGAAAVVVDALFEPARLRSWIAQGTPLASAEFGSLLKGAEASLARAARSEAPAQRSQAAPAQLESRNAMKVGRTKARQ